MAILITGGTGYIGSHIAAALLAAGEQVVLMDDASNSDVFAVERAILEMFPDVSRRHACIQVGDVTSYQDLHSVFSDHHVSSVIHCAGLKSVAESMMDPIGYFHNNVGGLTTVLAVMKEAGVNNLVFSSSATIYGNINLPAHESFKRGVASSVYGHTKQMCEEIIDRLGMNTATLRYFNPIGAHSSGLLRDSPTGKPNNLMPILCERSATGQPLQVFGGDYDTVDGTCERDYVHVCDVAEAHIAALNFIHDGGKIVANIGTGKPTTVLELVDTFNKFAKQKVEVEIVGRRPGDVASLYAGASPNAELIGWRARRTLDDMCRDTVNAFGL